MRLISTPENELIRFWQKVKKTDNCWIWTSSKTNSGYGLFSRGLYGTKKVYAHRLSWEIHNGSLPGKLFVCHKCDNPPCINPEHLFLGTNSDNIRDCFAKGRGNKTLMNYQKSKTHCSKGHEFNKENTRIYDKNPTHRKCKQCSRDRSLRRYYLLKNSSKIS